MTHVIQGYEIALGHLQNSLSRKIFNRWIAPLKFSEKTGGSLILTAPSLMVAEEVSILFGHAMLEAFRLVWPEIVCIRIKSPSQHQRMMRNRVSQTKMEFIYA